MVYHIIFNFFDEQVMLMIYSRLSSENFESQNIFIEGRRAA